MREPGARDGMPLLLGQVRHADSWMRHARGRDAPIGPCLDRNRRELARRAKRLWRKHCSRKVEAEELAGTVLVRDGQTAPCEVRRADDGGENIFQNQKGLLKHSKNGI